MAHQAAREIALRHRAAALASPRSELAPRVNEDTQLTAADEWIDGPASGTGTIVPCVQPVGPHTPEDVVVYLPQQRVLFAGDLVFLPAHFPLARANNRQWIRALDALLAFDAQVVVPAMGPCRSRHVLTLRLTRLPGACAA